ncbi:MAG: hypothetical protein ACRD0C_16615 [Acidimicrobiia bacterium]
MLLHQPLRADWALAAHRLHMVLSQALSDEELDELLESADEAQPVSPSRAA